MELSSLLHDLHLLSSEKPLPPSPLPPITELLARLTEKLIGASSDSDTSSLIGRVERLFQTADPDWLFSLTSVNEEEEEGEEEEELQAAYRSLLSALIGCADLPLCEDDSSPAPAAYQSVPSRAVPVCSVLRALLGALGRRGGAGLLLRVAPPVCVFAVTHFQDQLWTSPPSRAAAQSLQEALLRAGGWRDSAHLLVGEGGAGGGILTGVLDVLQPQLTKDSWQRCVAVKLVFSWTLLQLARPSLSPHLTRLLPPPLLFNDHYRPENCMLGVRCLHHIILNTPAADLRQFNRADVIYQALFKHLYTTETTVIQLALSCLLDLLLVLEKPPSLLDPASSRRKPCRHDDVLRLVLVHMEAETNVALRRVYASVLPLLVDRMGVAVCRHLQRVERVVLGYLEVRDPPEETSRLKVLEVLQRTTRAAWPRMTRPRLHRLLSRLLQLLLDVSSDSRLHVSVRDKLMRDATLSVQLLHACSPGDAQSVLLQVDSSCCSPEVLGCLATVTMTTER
ncbi:TELO2-interacting protein 2 [Limanda limanda]|uniref:TELO2-interacting protein 2 n=1 Tax=Limanda limanda TaxID=27771 RepID=UPI0029C86A59|nr:TELO2-interacting protein 2 [Limanda limanda]